ncbi:MAG: hypothetical protein IPK74_11415 [Deltaproteobacteria bacterium]|nr:hypothetical protein [Deltaproteobacteria bacterium]
MVRRNPGLLGVTLLCGCWNGAAALHKPCEVDAQCGSGQRCSADGFCDGPPTTTSSSSSDGTDSDGACAAVLSNTCDPTARIDAHTLSSTPIVNADFSRALAVGAADLLGDDRIELVVLSLDNYNVSVMENVGGGNWQAGAAPYSTPITDPRDLAVIDVETDGVPEFLLLAQNGQVDVVGWDGTSATSRATVNVAADDLLTLSATNIFGDVGPELLLAGSSALYVVPNIAGSFQEGDVRKRSGSFYKPWDMLVVGGAVTRVLLPESDDMSFSGALTQQVQVVRIDGGDLTLDEPLATDLQNPWAIAQGDFFGDDELEVAVVERRLDSPGDVNYTDITNSPGRLRFYRVDDTGMTALGEPLETAIGPVALQAADLDCDGKSELVIASTGPAGASAGQNQVFFGSCDPLPQASRLETFPDAGGVGVVAGTRMAVADFDDDGLLEVAIPDLGNLADPEAPGERVVLVGVEAAP